ncbi:fatty acyl-AMP ligase [Serratia ureilytica]|uniref:fatty acyl-AMP ligase n=1 Tax=Serratia ureilytica TaxID=300181 RepID=UPI001CBECF1A|nr:fatty acyl-AMP ligase [Serratia ureilytica]UAN29283.1 fatty acyl-AMP ligase [Serratia ureilytica]
MHFTDNKPFDVPQTANEQQAYSIADICHWRGLNQPDAIAYRFLHNGLDEYEVLTYGGLLQRIQTVSTSFTVAAATPADRALLLFPSGLDYIASFYACLYSGVIAVPAYPMLSHADSLRLRVIINDCQPKYILTHSSLKSSLLAWFEQEGMPLGKFDVIFVDEIPLIRGASTATTCGEIAFLQYTSGSTGNPKGVMVSNRNLMHNSASIYRSFGHDARSVVVSWLPPFHDMGLVGGILQPLFAGFEANIMSPMTFLRRPLRWLHAISTYGATSSGGPNFSYKLCLKQFNARHMNGIDLSSWKVAFNGAEPIQSGTLAEFEKVFGDYGFSKQAFYPCYGLAEATLFVSGGSPQTRYSRIDADKNALLQYEVARAQTSSESQRIIGVGAVADNTVLIIDPIHKTVLPDNRIGEIWCAGHSVAQGYWQRPQESEQNFQAYTADGRGPYMRTGDLGFFDKAELYVSGRLKEVVIINGRNYFPADIEHTVQSVSPALRPDCGAVIAVDGDGEQMIVVQEIERIHQGKVSLYELKEQINARCFQQYGIRPDKIIYVEQSQIPKTTSGKVKRLQIKQAYLSGDLKCIPY